MKEKVLKLIKQIIAKKIKERIEPNYVLHADLLQYYSPDQLKDPLNELFQEGKIRIGNTINSTWIEIA